MGNVKPRFFARTMDSGKRRAAALRTTDFPTRPCSFAPASSVEAHSTSPSSRKGTRLSSDAAMLM